MTDPYNLYFTPDGHYAIVVEERMQALAFRDAQTMQLHHTLHVPCPGVNHMDFTADGRYLVASCEFGGDLIKVDVRREKVVGTLRLLREQARRTFGSLPTAAPSTSRICT